MLFDYHAHRKSELKNLNTTYESTNKEILDLFQLEPNTLLVAQLPRYSFMLQIPFKLVKPYISKDNLDLLDNPIYREKVFRIPMVAPTGWKGSLRTAILQQINLWWYSLDELQKKQRIYRKMYVAKKIQFTRLFGNERNVNVDEMNNTDYLPDEFSIITLSELDNWYHRYIKYCISNSGFFAGRLNFYPTFFNHTDRIALEVINPHSRTSGCGVRGPILLECVPKEGTGLFSLLYVPFGKSSINEQKLKEQVAEDLSLLADGLHAMFLTYGFGAKTSSGFGRATIDGTGKIYIHTINIKKEFPSFQKLSKAVLMVTETLKA